MASLTPSLHALLLLSDSALPLGSFAFSSGLESFLAHHKSPTKNKKVQLQEFESFIQHSLANVASTALPYVLAGLHSPEQLESLDNDFDASTPCTVARRASIAQGKALLTIWERALSPSTNPSSNLSTTAASVLNAFATSVKSPKQDAFGLQLNAHFPPLFGTTCLALGLSEYDTSYLFLLNHAKTLLSAAVRASVVGPYQSQAMLAGSNLQTWILTEAEKGKSIEVEDACVTIPTMDLWMGRHELLYSRIFNS